jgi:predicted enzyme related to lactoylglutathione lyase
MPPTLAPGKIAYVQIPATDVDRSAEFYKAAFRLEHQAAR